MFYTFQLRVRFELCECGCFVTLLDKIENNNVSFGLIIFVTIVHST